MNDAYSSSNRLPAKGGAMQFRIGRILCLLGGAGGVIVVVIFSVSQVVAFSASLSQMPLNMLLTVFGGEIISLLLIGGAFAIISVLAARSSPQQKKLRGLTIFFIALILTVISFLTLPTIGFFIMPMAIAGLVGAVVILASLVFS